MNVLFIYRGELQRQIFLKNATKVPFDFLYGYCSFSGSKSYIIAPRTKRQTITEKLFYLIEKPFSLSTKLGLPLEIYFLFKEPIKSASHIFCVNDAIGLSICFYKMLGLIDAKIIVLMQSLSERLKYFRMNKLLLWLISKMLHSADMVLTLSDCAQMPLHETFGIPFSRLLTFFFGVDTEYWFYDPKIVRENFILSIGNDINRDFDSLLSALPDDLPLKLITTQRIDTQNKNVELLKNISDADLRSLYQTCLFAIIPSRKVDYESSGLSCIMQSMACGAPVIASDAPPLRELFWDRGEICYYNPEDPADLRKKIDVLREDEILRRNMSCSGYDKIIKTFTTKNMAQQLETIMSSI